MPKYLDYHGLETLKTDLEAIYLKKAQRGAANGVASLDSNGKVPASQIPEGVGGHDIPSGGTSGQVLSKASATDYDVEWTTPANPEGVLYTSDATGSTSLSGQEGAVIPVGYSNGLKVSVPYKRINCGDGISELVTTKTIDGNVTKQHFLLNDGILDITVLPSMPGKIQIEKTDTPIWSNPDSPVYSRTVSLLTVVNIASTAETQAIITEYGVSA